MHTNYCIILLGWNNSSFHLIIQKTKMGSSCKQDFYKPFYTIIMLSIIYLQLLEGFDNLIFKCWGFFFLNTARLKNTCINNQMAVLIWYCLTIDKPSLHYRKWYLVNGNGSGCPIFLFWRTQGHVWRYQYIFLENLNLGYIHLFIVKDIVQHWQCSYILSQYVDNHFLQTTNV